MASHAISRRYILSLKTFLLVAMTTTLLVMYVHHNRYVVNVKLLRLNNMNNDDNQLLNDENKEKYGSDLQACVHPTLEVSDPVMMRFYKRINKIECKGDKNWVFVENGTIRFSEDAKIRHKNVQCYYYPLIRGPGDYNISFGQPVGGIQDGAPIVSDFFKIVCRDDKNMTYENIHAGVHVNVTIKERLRATKPPANGLGLSIAFLGFDSMSRMSWLRRMPNTRKYIVNDLKAIELEGYNIVGDATPAALFPILTGKREDELPDARRGFKGAKPVDDFPWLWRNFSKHGYVTSWADAQIGIAPFNYRLLGFEHSPADYFMRPFFLAADPTYKKYTPDCHASEPKHTVWFNWIRDIFYMYKHDPKFLFHFYTPLSHDDNNKITMADDDMRSFLNHLETGGYLNNTLLLVMADHGARFASVRGTFSGNLEERLPYVSLRFPPWFENKYPDLIKNVRTNVNRLTTPFDLHETFTDFLRFDGAGLGDVKNRGISLFKEIPKSRTCTDAGVSAHWCACLIWKTVPQSDPYAIRALQTALETLNNLTQEYRSDCALLNIGNVTKLSKLNHNEDILRFKKNKDDRSIVLNISDKIPQIKTVIYQLTFFTEPGQGHFEITLEHSIVQDKMSVNPRSISRINKYGKDPACILDKTREIRQFCYCKNNHN